jgi:hypothetical protein
MWPVDTKFLNTFFLLPVYEQILKIAKRNTLAEYRLYTLRDIFWKFFYYLLGRYLFFNYIWNIFYTAILMPLKGQSHEKVGEIRA